MLRLRHRVKLLSGAVGALSFGACLLAGCSVPTITAPLAPGALGSAHSTVLNSGHLTDAQAEIVMARAIAEHEIRRP